MEVKFERFGFYKIDKEYMKFLNSRDEQVFYRDVKGYEKKPHLGIIAKIGDVKYCIPLTSAKIKQLHWASISKHNLVIYEIMEESEISKGDIYKKNDTSGKYKKLLGVLEIRKMIPVKDGVYDYINFEKIKDSSYKNLLKKEYLFLQPHKQTILDKTIKLYNKQKRTGIIEPCYCNFEILEKACNEYDSRK